MYCSACGKQILDNSKFCSFCGAPTTNDENFYVSDATAFKEAEKHSIIGLQPEIEENSTTNINRFIDDDKWFKTATKILGGLIFIVIVIFIVIAIQKNSIPAKFKTEVKQFLIESDKLNIMTSQGVTNSDFRNQLANVKSDYNQLENSWPSALTTEKSNFDEALRGWDLTLQVWDDGLKRSGNMDYLYLNNYNSFLQNLSVDYINADAESTQFYSYNDWIGALMAMSSQNYEEGKDSINEKIK